MNLSSTFANLAWVASNGPAWLRFRRALRSPAATQFALLSHLLRRNSDCAYGRAHGFAGIRTPEAFSRQVPLVDYDDMKPWITRVQGGEMAVLTRDSVQHLIPTSGSTGARKLIPFTAGLQREFNRAIGPWIDDLYRQHPTVALGPAYWSVTPSTRREEREPSAVPIGFDDDSRYLGGMRRRLVDAVMAVPSALRFVSDIESFRYLTLFCLLRQRNLRLISVWHPSFLTLLLDALPGFWDSLLEDIRTGRCSRADSLPTALRESLRLRPLPERADALRGTDPHRSETVWPVLKVISCWSDGHAALAVTELQRRFSNTLIQPKGLLATEAFVTIPFLGRHPVAVRSHFFEFIDDAGRVHLTHELRNGETYDVVVTTAGGLWRYRLRDRVAVTGFADQTPSLRFLGKSNNVSDRFGEKLSEAFVAQVVRDVTAQFPRPGFALLAPDEDSEGWRYTLYVEGMVSAEVAGRLDAGLRRNPHYACCRDLGQLMEARVFQIHSGGYETFVTREMSHGRRLGEIKAASLSERGGWSRCFKLADPSR